MKTRGALDRYACVRRPELFFPIPTDLTETLAALTGAAEGIEAAKHMCATCPIRLQCREDAQARGETAGIWGGWAPEEERIHAALAERRVKRRKTPTVAAPAPLATVTVITPIPPGLQLSLLEMAAAS